MFIMYITKHTYIVCTTTYTYLGIYRTPFFLSTCFLCYPSTPCTCTHVTAKLEELSDCRIFFSLFNYKRMVSGYTHVHFNVIICIILYLKFNTSVTYHPSTIERPRKKIIFNNPVSWAGATWS